MSTIDQKNEPNDYCIEALKGSDQYIQLLFFPEAKRNSIATILAFQKEIDRIPYLVSEPMPGEIRLQWWREVFSGERLSEAKANPLAISLLSTIGRFDLPTESFVRYLDAKVFDLYNDPMPDRETLETYLGETECFILQQLALINDSEHDTDLANACGHGGVALGIAKIILQLPYNLNCQQSYVPSDLIEACGIDVAAWLSGETQNHISAYHGFAALGQEHLRKAKLEIAKLSKDKRSAFLSLSIAELVFERAIKKSKGLREPIVISPLSKQWALWKKSLFGF